MITYSFNHWLTVALLTYPHIRYAHCVIRNWRNINHLIFPHLKVDLEEDNSYTKHLVDPYQGKLYKGWWIRLFFGRWYRPHFIKIKVYSSKRRKLKKKVSSIEQVSSTQEGDQTRAPTQLPSEKKKYMMNCLHPSNLWRSVDWSQEILSQILANTQGQINKVNSNISRSVIKWTRRLQAF